MESLGAGREDTEDASSFRDADRPAGVRAAGLDFRPRGVGELLDLAAELLRVRLPLLVGTAFLLWIPIAWVQRNLLILPHDAPEPQVVALIALGVFLPFLATVLTGAVTAMVTIPWLRGEVLQPGAMGRLVAAVPSLLLVSLVTILAIGAGIFTCGIASIFFWWKLLVAPMVVVVESPNPLRALRRSFALTRFGFGRWIGAYLGSVLIMLPLGIAGKYAGDGTLDELLFRWYPQLGPNSIEILILLVSGLVFALPAAYGAALVAVFYVDLLVRREAWDLELRLERLRERPTTGPNAPNLETPGLGGLA